MKFRLNIVWTIFVSLLVSCGSEPAAPSSPPAKQFQLNLRLPSELTQKEDRYARFMAQVDYLWLAFELPTGEKREVVLPPNQWENVILDFDQWIGNGVDEILVQVRVWDRKRDGSPRPFAALRGKKKLKIPDELNSVIPLTLDVPVREYD